MYGGVPVKRNRITNKRTHKVRRLPNRPAYYTLKQSNINKYREYFKNILPKLAPKSTVTVRKSERISREPIRFDPSVYNIPKTMKNRGTKLNGSATTAAGIAAANDRIYAVSAAKERLAVVNRARQLYGVSDATKSVRAAFIRSYIRAKQLGATYSQALSAAENEIATATATASAAAASAAAPAVPVFANNNADNIEAMFADLRI